MAQTIDRKTGHTAVGKRTRRQDGFDKVVGRTRYAGDLTFAGLLHARLVLSPYAHARIAKIDTAAALEVPGVKAVYTSKTLGMADPESSARTQSPLASPLKLPEVAPMLLSQKKKCQILTKKNFHKM